MKQKKEKNMTPNDIYALSRKFTFCTNVLSSYHGKNTAEVNRINEKRKKIAKNLEKLLIGPCGIQDYRNCAHELDELEQEIKKLTKYK